MTVIHRALLAVLLILWSKVPLAEEPPLRIVTPDWTVAETLLALEIEPQGVGEIAGYRTWVGTPSMPDSVTDIGLRTQPNLELLAQLRPDRILLTPMFRSLERPLSRIAPVEVIGHHTDGSAWEAVVEQTRAIGRLTNRREAAAALIRSTEQHIASLRSQIGDPGKPLLIVQFMDAVHARVFGMESLYGSVLTQLGLRNAWSGRTNAWGFALIGLQELAAIDGRLIVVAPTPIGNDITATGLWQTLPSVERDEVLWLPAAWSFGALPSARRFAGILVDAL